MLHVPDGFKISLFADRLSGPRIIRTAPNGDIFVVETRAGRLRVLRAADGASKPDANEVYATGLDHPFGIAFFPTGANPQWLYVANTDNVVRFPYRSGDLKASAQPETIVAELPHGGGHSTRDIVFTPNNKRMLISVGSGSNVARNWPSSGRRRSLGRRTRARRQLGFRDRSRRGAVVRSQRQGSEAVRYRNPKLRRTCDPAGDRHAMVLDQ
jgi:glucose/arabinose dehydrogenase